MPPKAKDVLEAWKGGSPLSEPMLDALANEFEELLRAEYALATQLANAGRQDEATSQLLQTNAFASAVTHQRPALVDKLGPVAADLREAVRALARTLGAGHFSITVGFPAGISVSLTFDLP